MAFTSKDTRRALGTEKARPVDRIPHVFYSTCHNSTCIIHPIHEWRDPPTPDILLAEVCICHAYYEDPATKKSKMCRNPQWVKHPVRGLKKISDDLAKRFAVDCVLYVERGKDGKWRERQGRPYPGPVSAPKELFNTFISKSSKDSQDEVPF